jgi:hypothetical protein
MADEIKVEHDMWKEDTYQMSFMKLTMTNARGTAYSTHIFKDDFGSKRGPYPSRVTNAATGVSIRTRNTPKWVQRTIEEQLPIVAILLS